MRQNGQHALHDPGSPRETLTAFHGTTHPKCVQTAAGAELCQTAVHEYHADAEMLEHPFQTLGNLSCMQHHRDSVLQTCAALPSLQDPLHLLQRSWTYRRHWHQQGDAPLMPYFSISPLSVTTRYVASPFRPCTNEWSPAKKIQLSQNLQSWDRRCLRQGEYTSCLDNVFAVQRV
jgi:hypothetical protein